MQRQWYVEARQQNIITHAEQPGTVQNWGKLVGLTFIQRGELPHLRRETLVELMLPGDEGLADGLLPKS